MNEKQLLQHRETQRKWRDKNREIYRSYQRNYRRKVRREVIAHYGNKCECCGEDVYEFLTIDHINGGGGKHRKETKEVGLSVWLKRNGFPNGFQILCFNCNNAKSNYGKCPHKME